MTYKPPANEFWVPDHKLWLEESKRNLAARKAEWKIIQPIVKELARLERPDKGYISIHKSLFFKGEIPKAYLTETSSYSGQSSFGKSGGSKFFYAFVLFYFWYHPCLTEEIIEKTFKRFTEDPLLDSERATSIAESRTLLFKRQNSKKWFDNYGFMGGKEELIGPYFLFGSKTGRAENAYRRGWFTLNDGRFFLQQLLPGGNILQGQGEHPKLGLVYNSNPRATGQYMWPQISHFIQENKLMLVRDPEENNTEMTLKILRETIQKLLFFKEHPKTAENDPIAIEYRERIMNQYNKGELAEWLNEMFIEQEKLGLQEE